MSLPEPFFLPRPLTECSSEDLKHAMVPWLGRSNLHNKIKHTQRRLSSEWPGLCESLYSSTRPVRVLPGGRWCLVPAMDGSIWTIDTENRREKVLPRLLVPSPSFDSGRINDQQLHWAFAVDIASPQSIGPSREIHYLVQFNIAVVSCATSASHTVVEVWRIRIDAEGGPRLGPRLSSFQEKSMEVGFCSLYGEEVAYSSMNLPVLSFSIVNWVNANGKRTDGGYVRRVVQGSSMSVSIIVWLRKDD